MWAIRNKRTGKWLFGTWWQNGRVIQRTSDDMAMTFETEEYAKNEMRYRRYGKDYEAVPVRIEVLQ